MKDHSGNGGKPATDLAAAALVAASFTTVATDAVGSTWDSRRATDVTAQSATSVYLHQVYQDLLERPAEQAGLDYWTNQLRSGVPRLMSTTEDLGAPGPDPFFRCGRRPARSCRGGMLMFFEVGGGVMTLKVRVPIVGAYAMPAMCCNCGASAIGSTYTTPVSGSDMKGKHYVKLHFPLCEACGAAVQLVGETHLWHRRKLPEFRTWQKVQRCVRITSVSYPIFGKPTMVCKFEDDDFGRMFEADNLALLGR